MSNSALKAALLLMLAVWTLPVSAASRRHGPGYRLAQLHRIHPIKSPGIRTQHPRLALAGGRTNLDRPYGGAAMSAVDRPMPTTVSYRFKGRGGPVGVVGYRVFNPGHPLDWHDVNAAASGSRFGAPDDVMGASLNYTFR